MGRFLIELLRQFIQEMIPLFLKSIGASIKWIFYGRRKTDAQILEEEWNIRIGLEVILVIFSVILYVST